MNNSLLASNDFTGLIFALTLWITSQLIIKHKKRKNLINKFEAIKSELNGKDREYKWFKMTWRLWEETTYDEIFSFYINSTAMTGIGFRVDGINLYYEIDHKNKEIFFASSSKFFPVTNNFSKKYKESSLLTNNPDKAPASLE